MSPPSTLRKVASARWLRLPSEPEYSETGRVKEMEEYMKLRKQLADEALARTKVEQHGWDSDDDDPPVIRREIYKCKSLEDAYTSNSKDKDKPLPTEKPLPALPGLERPPTARTASVPYEAYEASQFPGMAQEQPHTPIKAEWTREIVSNNPSVRYRKRDKIRAFFKFDNPFAKNKEDNHDLFVKALVNPVTTPKQGDENQSNRRGGLTALPSMPSASIDNTPATSIATMPETKKSKFFNFKKEKGGE